MKKTNLSEYDRQQVPDGSGYRIAIVVAEWNAAITEAMLQGAYETLQDNGVVAENIEVRHVPGTYELPTGADLLLQGNEDIDAVICIGCVIQGETRHFDFICQAASNGIMEVALRYHKPVIFSVLTTESMEQAEARAGGKHGNKGVEGAISALKMCQYNK